jgi:hypothetical protein
MGCYLALMPINENLIDGDKSDRPAHAHGGQHARFPEADHRYLQRATHLQETRFLEMADDEGVVPGTLGFECVADGLRGAAEFSQWMEMSIGRVKAVDLESNAGAGCLLKKRL